MPMTKISKKAQTEIAAYCKRLRADLDLEPPEYSFDSWNTVQIYDGGLFRCNDETTPFALYGFQDEVSPACARKLGSCRFKRLMNEHLASVWFETYAKETEIVKKMKGGAVEPPKVYANCFKLIPVKRELFRTIDINEDGMFEIELTPDKVGTFAPPEEDLPKKNGSACFPIRFRLSGGLPTGPVKFSFHDMKRLKSVTFACGGENYEFFTGTSYEAPEITIEKWRAREDEEGVYLDVLLEMHFRGFYLME